MYRNPAFHQPSSQNPVKPTSLNHREKGCLSQPAHKENKQKQAVKIGLKLPLQRVFLVLSRMHYAFKLRYQTLFLAMEIYVRYAESEVNPEEEHIPEGCLILVCAYLSMKFEEIYPPRLKHLVSFVKTNPSLDEYSTYEKRVLLKLNLNLNITTAKEILEDLLKNSSEEVYYHAYYLLEIAYS